MVILSIHNSADIYGASRTLLGMLKLLADDGNNVHVVLPRSGPLTELLRTQGISVHVFPALAVIERTELETRRGQIRFSVCLAYSILWLSVLILRLRADVVHTNTAVLPAPALAARITGRRHVWHIREFFSEFPSIWKFYQKYMFVFSTTIITISAAVKGQFDLRFQTKCKIVYDGMEHDSFLVDIDRARQFRLSTGAPQFLVGVVGRIKWVRKGQEVLIKAAALLAKSYPEVQYVVVGTAAAGNEDHLIRLRDLIREFRLEDRVTFTGDIQEMRDIYAAFDVTVVPSVLPEPFGCVVMESMAAGTPVIGSQCGGIPEQIVNGTTGLLFTPGDETDLARALAEFMSDPNLKIQMGNASRRHIQKNFGMAEAHQQFRAIFDG